MSAGELYSRMVRSICLGVYGTKLFYAKSYSEDLMREGREKSSTTPRTCYAGREGHLVSGGITGMIPFRARESRGTVH